MWSPPIPVESMAGHGRPWQNRAVHIMADREKRERESLGSSGLSSFFSFISSGPPAYGLRLPTFRAYLPPPLVNPLWKHFTVSPEECVTNLLGASQSSPD
jgi:hypothetical protein